MSKDRQVWILYLATNKGKERPFCEVTLVQSREVKRQPCRDVGTVSQAEETARAKGNGKELGMFKTAKLESSEQGGAGENRKGGAEVDLAGPCRPWWKVWLYLRVKGIPGGQSFTH